MKLFSSHSSWSKSSLEDIAIHIIGGDWGKEPEFSEEGYESVSCIRGSEFKNWKKNFGNTAVIRKVKVSSLTSRELLKNDILVEISGGGPDQPVGRTVLIDDRVLNNQTLPLVCTNFLRLVRLSSEVSASFINRYLEFFYSSGEVTKYQGGSNNLRNLKFKDYSKIEIPLPLLAEQKIIAEKLDTLLAQVDSTKARLEQIPQILKRFRQAVLAAAVSGKLTEIWRTRNPNKTTQNLLKDHTPLPRPARWKTRSTSLISGVHATAVGNPKESPVAEWEWVPLVDVARMESGHTPSRNKPEYWGGEVCWIGIRDANRNHSSTILDTEQKTNELGLANSASRLLPKGTVCISRTASVGYVVKMGRPMATSQDFVNWVPCDVIDADWLKWLFVSERESLFRFGKGSTHTTIYFPEWLSLHILLPHLSEQQEIVRRVEQLLAYADTIEKQVNSALDRVSNLTQSILAKAFRGELTAQWRAENPDLISGENSAAALLEKIKAERTASSSKKASRKKA